MGALSFVSLGGLLVLSACDKQSVDAPSTDPSAAADPARPVPEDEADADASPEEDRLAALLAMEHRSPENKARDVWRHPAETLSFFGVRPDSTVVELWPGGGWYTEILAPYLAEQGRLIVTIFDPQGPEAYYGTGQAKKMLERIETQPDVFGKVETVTVPQKVKIGKDGKVQSTTLEPFELAPEGTVDVVLTFRNSHGWYNNDVQELVYGAAFKALKPGGVFGVVQHRADEGADPKESAKKGYLPEAEVIAAAKAVGFELAEKSEINANPNDTKDHPDGVWSLPPSLRGAEDQRAKYEAIGESDRMTLKFVKP